MVDESSAVDTAMDVTAVAAISSVGRFILIDWIRTSINIGLLWTDRCRRHQSKISKPNSRGGGVGVSHSRGMEAILRREKIQYYRTEVWKSINLHVYFVLHKNIGKWNLLTTLDIIMKSWMLKGLCTGENFE